MPGKADKKLEQMRQHPRNWARRDVVRVLRRKGFIEDKERGRGSHVMFYHKEFEDLDLFLPSDDPVAIYVVKQLLALAEELRKRGA
ncbi:MAG: type II toxin-antitoxin system HicA family toxin [Chloroflexota bacterium]|nr:type II toxin-antitoxin system HicA family toxin [Chloroflexota bacterium]MDE2950447.1 type II toxin-antitoxin system HicA family toxin [Chloroflexota bacterium]